jgi:hypothetical protein
MPLGGFGDQVLAVCDVFLGTQDHVEGLEGMDLRMTPRASDRRRF